MTKKVRTAVFGLGRLGYWHAVNITKDRQAELVSVCDPKLETAEKVARELDIPQFTINPEDILKDDSIEAVVIATPTSTHYDLLTRASQAGKAIFIEKPLTIDLAEAIEIKNVLEANSTLCQVGFMRRFDPAYDAAKKRITAGDIGEPIYFRGISRDPIPPPESFIARSGGIFIDLSIHDYDVARYLMGSEVEKVSSNGCVLKNPFMKKYNDVDQALTYLEFASGAAGDTEASRIGYYGYDIRAEVIGTEGSIFIGNLRENDIQILSKTGNTHDIIPDFPSRFKDAYALELEAFFKVVNEKAVPRVTVDDGVVALAISYAAKESYQTGKKVALDQVLTR